MSTQRTPNTKHRVPGLLEQPISNITPLSTRGRDSSWPSNISSTSKSPDLVWYSFHLIQIEDISLEYSPSVLITRCEVNFIHVFHLQIFTVDIVSLETATACCGTVASITDPIYIDSHPWPLATSTFASTTSPSICAVFMKQTREIPIRMFSLPFYCSVRRRAPYSVWLGPLFPMTLPVAWVEGLDLLFTGHELR